MLVYGVVVSNDTIDQEDTNMVLPIMINRAGITWDPWDEMGQLQQAVRTAG